MQSLGGTSIASEIKTRPVSQSVCNEDIVLWHTFGTTHNPRIEDRPVMPVEKMMVTLKPVNIISVFFECPYSVLVSFFNPKGELRNPHLNRDITVI